VHFLSSQVPISAVRASNRFIRIPRDFLETVLQLRLSGLQWAVLCWVIHRTLGLNRNTTPFSWYRIAIELAMDRAGVVRAGHNLLRAGILYLEGNKIGIRRTDVRRSRLAPDDTAGLKKDERNSKN
jgi:hypothetical protein